MLTGTKLKDGKSTSRDTIGFLVSSPLFPIPSLHMHTKQTIQQTDECLKAKAAY